ncbi:hypothetical protein C8R46DRAFT_1226935 [Mycena filopes]|nr:hypothetical protein C8R46DRAFT_1226935 [Mycena filopes]
MRPSTIFAAVLTLAFVVSAAPLADSVVRFLPIPTLPNNDLIHPPHRRPCPAQTQAPPPPLTPSPPSAPPPRAAQKSFLLAIDPKTWTLPPAALEQIAKQPKVAKRLNGAALTMQNMRNWLVRFDAKHAAEGKQA